MFRKVILNTFHLLFSLVISNNIYAFRCGKEFLKNEKQRNEYTKTRLNLWYSKQINLEYGHQIVEAKDAESFLRKIIQQPDLRNKTSVCDYDISANFPTYFYTAITGCDATSLINDFKFKEVSVFAVDFKLCEDNSSDCDEELAFDAKNYPVLNIILVNISRWNRLKDHERWKIALHEYFGIMNAERSHYNLSSRFFYHPILTKMPNQNKYYQMHVCSVLPF